MITDSKITDCIFDDGESPLKETRNLDIERCRFEWKYPLWYAHSIKVDNSLWLENARAGVWYTEDIEISNTLIKAPKNFRRCKNLTLKGVTFSDAQETLWGCDGVVIDSCSAKGNYFGMNCSNLKISHFDLDGDYGFDGVKNIEISHSHLATKDAFWNSENVVIRDSSITGEYFGWNSKNVTLINCTIESLQGFCYMKGVTLINCRLLNTNLCFEFCENIDADIISEVISIKNPISGKIKVKKLQELIIDDSLVDRTKTVIEVLE